MNFIKQFFNAIKEKHKKILKDERLSNGLKKSFEYENQLSNPKLHRTERDEDLSFNFSQKYASIISKYEEEIYDKVRLAARSIRFGNFDIDEMIKLHENAVKSFYEFQDFCFNKSKGGKVYFEDMWLYCHNSTKEKFSYISSCENELLDLKSNYDEKKQYFDSLSNVKIKIKQLLNNQSEIEQKELCKKFLPLKASDVLVVIKNLKEEDFLVVEKQLDSRKIIKKI